MGQDILSDLGDLPPRGQVSSRCRFRIQGSEEAEQDPDHLPEEGSLNGARSSEEDLGQSLHSDRDRRSERCHEFPLPGRDVRGQGRGG